MAASSPMLKKLRSREPLDLPVEGWKKRTPTLAILGVIAVVFLFVPFLLALVVGVFDPDTGFRLSRAQAVAAGVGTLLLVLLLGGLLGKPGWQRR